MLGKRVCSRGGWGIRASGGAGGEGRERRWRERAMGHLLAFPEWYESPGSDVSREGAGPYLGVAGTLHCRVGTGHRVPRPSSKVAEKVSPAAWVTGQGGNRQGHQKW